MPAAMSYELTLPWWLAVVGAAAGALIAAAVWRAVKEVVSRATGSQRPWVEGQEKHSPLTPDLEQAARERFHPSGPPGDPGVIRPADDGVRDGGA